MAVNRARVAIVGCGPGSPSYLTEAAREAAGRADVLVGSRRFLKLFAHCSAEQICVNADLTALMDRIVALHSVGRRIAVLVAGDPGLYSLARSVIRRFGRAECEVIPAVSSVQVAFARLGLDWADARILSAHGRTPQITADELGRSDTIAILAGTQDALRWSANVAQALGTHAVFLAENLTLADERLEEVSAEQLRTTDAASLSVILLIRRSLLS